MSHQENTSVARDIRIHGIPIKEGENTVSLLNLFDKICQVVKITAPYIESIYRMKKTSSPRNDPDIIVRLKSSYDRNFVLRSIAKHCRSAQKQLSLREIGLDSDVSLYVHECLTKANYDCLKLALRLKKQQKLHAAFTRRGLVHVKQTENSDLICFDTEHKISELLKLNSGVPSQFFPAINQNAQLEEY